MMSQVLSNHGITSLAPLGMLIFMGVFVAVLFQTLNRKNQARFARLAQLPLGEGEDQNG